MYVVDVHEYRRRRSLRFAGSGDVEAEPVLTTCVGALEVVEYTGMVMSESNQHERRGALVRVGVDSSYGGWNAPVLPETGEYVYVPIPETHELRSGCETPYSDAEDALEGFREAHDIDGVGLPERLRSEQMHLDPDFGHLTYGEINDKADVLAEFEEGDFLAFYAGLEPVPGTSAPHEGRLVYALIGLLVLDDKPQVVVDSETGDTTGVPEQRYPENAHTRRKYAASDMEERRETHGSDTHADVVVRGEPERSGRLRRCIDIGSYRDGAYRVRESLLEEWGGLSGTNDGFIQRSLLLPEFEDPSGFLRWLDRREPELVRNNFGTL